MFGEILVGEPLDGIINLIFDIHWQRAVNQEIAKEGYCHSLSFSQPAILPLRLVAKQNKPPQYGYGYKSIHNGGLGLHWLVSVILIGATSRSNLQRLTSSHASS